MKWNEESEQHGTPLNWLKAPPLGRSSRVPASTFVGPAKRKRLAVTGRAAEETLGAKNSWAFTAATVVRVSRLTAPEPNGQWLRRDILR